MRERDGILDIFFRRSMAASNALTMPALDWVR